MYLAVQCVSSECNGARACAWWVIVKNLYSVRLQPGVEPAHTESACMRSISWPPKNPQHCFIGQELACKDEERGKAFFTSRTYLLAGVLLEKPTSGSEKSGDLTEELLSIMTSLH